MIKILEGEWKPVVLWLFVINLGIALGAGIYESRIVVPLWIELPPTGDPIWNPAAALRDNTGLRFWAWVSTGPLTLLTIASFLIARTLPSAAKKWWIRAAAVSLLERAFTFTYFVPTMLRLMNGPADEAAARTALMWAQLNHLRHALVFIAFVAALRAFASLYELRDGGRLPARAAA